jgi:predicted transcriptional regulator
MAIIQNDKSIAQGQKNQDSIPSGKRAQFLINRKQLWRSTTVPVSSPSLPRNAPMPQTLLEMAKDLVLAQIEARNLSPDEMHQALQHTYASLQALKAQGDAHGSVAVAAPETPPVPVNWRKSITKHTVTCLACGASFKQLSVRHLKEHGLDGRSYRVKYSIPRTQPLSAKETTSRRKVIVQRTRPWEKAPTFVKAQKKTREQAPVAQRK